MTGGPAERTDGELAALAIAGSEAAFAEIVRRHKQPLHRLVAGITGDEDEALDILQETFVAAHGSLRRFDMARSMRAWLARIAINKARDHRRRRFVRRLISVAMPDHAADIPHEVPAIDRQVGDRAELARVQSAIDRLPERLRETLILRTIDEFTQAQAAEVLGISEKAVETRLYRARRRLVALLDDPE